jgi:hypothetical protein
MLMKARSAFFMNMCRNSCSILIDPYLDENSQRPDSLKTPKNQSMKRPQRRSFANKVAEEDFEVELHNSRSV